MTLARPALQKILLTLAILIVSVKSDPTPPDAPSVINIFEGGPIQGETVPAGDGINHVYSWKGIPYGKSERFSPPIQADSWADLKTTTGTPYHCIQPTIDGLLASGYYNFEQNEDCLLLNVVVPIPLTLTSERSQTELRAVIVVIHGGAFTIGGVNNPINDPKILASMQDVIVVHINYRLAIFGFGYIQAGLAEGPTDNKLANFPGNMGLLDQKLALKWVQTNIGAFGGDKERVTLFGINAGAASIGHCLMSDECSKLFARGFMASGAPISTWGLKKRQDVYDHTLELASRVDCKILKPNENKVDKTATAACLRGKDIEDLAPLYDDASADLKTNFFDNVFGPTLDKNFLPKSFSELRTNHTANKQLIIGTVKDEGLLHLTIHNTTFNQDFNDSSPYRYFIKTDIRTYVDDCYKHYDIGTRDAIYAKYQPSVPAQASKPYPLWPLWNKNVQAIEGCDRMIGDQQFTCPMNAFSKKYLIDNPAPAGKLYQYFYECKNAKTDSFKSFPFVVQGDDSHMWFGHPFRLAQASLYTEEHRVSSRKFMTYLANFARTGDPNTPADSEIAVWPPWTESPANSNYLKLDCNTDALTSTDLTTDRNCAYWKDLTTY